MLKPQVTEQFLVTITSDKPIKDLCDHVANRLWSMDHVSGVTASRFFHEHGTDIHVVSMPEIEVGTKSPDLISAVADEIKPYTSFVGYMQGAEHV